MRKIILSAIAALGLTAPALGQEDWRSSAVSALPDTGEMHLQLIFQEEADGFMRLGWQVDAENGVINFYDRSMWAGPEIFETMTGSVDLETLAPIEASVRFHQQASIMSIEVNAENGVMTGERTLYQPYAGERSIPVSVPITDGMLMRASVFFLSQTLPLGIGESVSFDWFSSIGGAGGTVSMSAVDGGTIDTLSGRHETILLQLRGAAPENDIYVTDTDGVRQIVRIDILGQPMRFEAIPAPASEAPAAE